MTAEGFVGERRFLSNYATMPAEFEGLRYPTVEHAFAAAKTLDPEQRLLIRGLRTPGLAKAMGRKVNLRPDWEEVKTGIMGNLLKSKFAVPEMRAKLLATGDEELVEWNTWHDCIWGAVHL